MEIEEVGIESPGNGISRIDGIFILRILFNFSYIR